MADKRKLQGEIDRCFKKVTDGVEAFEDIWQKVQTASNANQKEKYEADLKKEIKKLQRLRDQIKSWAASNDIKDKSPLLENRRLIEAQMERFKVVERETKTKAYSKEGLGQAYKVDPATKEKDVCREWLNTSMDRIHIQIDQFECEIEAMRATGKKKRLDRDKQERIEELQEFIHQHRQHINKLETILRLLDNESLEVDSVNKVKDDIEYYIENCQEPDFIADEGIYDDLDLESDLPVSTEFPLRSDDAKDDDDIDDQISISPSSSFNSSGFSGYPSSPPSTKMSPRKNSKTSMSPDITSNGPSVTLMSSTPSTPNGKQQKHTSSSAVFTTASVVSSGTISISSSPPSTSIFTSSASVLSSGTIATPTSNGFPDSSSSDSSIEQSSVNQSGGLPTATAYASAVAASAEKSSMTQSTTSNPEPVIISETEVISVTTEVVTTIVPASIAPDEAPEDLTTTIADVITSTTTSTTSYSQHYDEPLEPASTDQPEQSPSHSFLSYSSAPVVTDSIPLPTTTTQSQSSNQLKLLVNQAQTIPADQASITPSSSSSSEFSPTTSSLFNSNQPATIQTSKHSVPETQEVHLQPLLGVAPLGPVQLTKERMNQSNMLDSAYRHMPLRQDSEKTRPYLPRNAVQVPPYHQHQLTFNIDSLEFFQKLTPDTLFFIFYYQEGTRAQYLAAKALKKQSWRFHTKFMMWFQRHEEPKTITDEYEQGTYIFFDYEKWSQRKKEGFTFEYRFLEDKDLA